MDDIDEWLNAVLDASSGHSPVAASNDEPYGNGDTLREDPAPMDVTSVFGEADDEILDTYVVQRGDSLNAISLHFYGTTDMVTAIMTLNDIDDPDRIFFGKVLLLPKR
jgi:nucleoid-associated protein YgaU